LRGGRRKIDSMPASEFPVLSLQTTKAQRPRVKASREPKPSKQGLALKQAKRQAAKNEVDQPK
jgi:hypothetical protein